MAEEIRPWPTSQSLAILPRGKISSNRVTSAIETWQPTPRQARNAEL